MVLGVVGATAYSSESAALLKKGETLQIADFTLTHNGIKNIQGPNFVSQQLQVGVARGDIEHDENMIPAKRFYTGHGSSTTEASLKTYGFSQLYVSVGDTDEEGRTVLRAWWKSQVILVWLGPILMSFGGLLSLTDRRLRIGAPMSSKAKRHLANA